MYILPTELKIGQSIKLNAHLLMLINYKLMQNKDSYEFDSKLIVGNIVVTQSDRYFIRLQDTEISTPYNRCIIMEIDKYGFIVSFQIDGPNHRKVILSSDCQIGLEYLKIKQDLNACPKCGGPTHKSKFLSEEYQYCPVCK